MPHVTFVAAVQSSNELQLKRGPQARYTIPQSIPVTVDLARGKCRSDPMWPLHTSIQCGNLFFPDDDIEHAYLITLFYLTYYNFILPIIIYKNVHEKNRNIY